MDISAKGTALIEIEFISIVFVSGFAVDAETMPPNTPCAAGSSTGTDFIVNAAPHD